MPTHLWKIQGSYHDVCHSFTGLSELITEDTIEESRTTIHKDLPRSRFIGTQREYNTWREAWLNHKSGTYVQGDMMGHFLANLMLQDYARYHQENIDFSEGELHFKNLSTIAFGMLKKNCVSGVAFSCLLTAPEYWALSLSDASNTAPNNCQVSLYLSPKLYHYLCSSKSTHTYLEQESLSLEKTPAIEIKQALTTIANHFNGEESQLLARLMHSDGRIRVTAFEALKHRLTENRSKYIDSKKSLTDIIKACGLDEAAQQHCRHLIENYTGFIHYLMCKTPHEITAIMHWVNRCDEQTLQSFCDFAKHEDEWLAKHLMDMCIADEAQLARLVWQDLTALDLQDNAQVLLVLKAFSDLNAQFMQNYTRLSDRERVAILKVIRLVENACQSMSSDWARNEEKTQRFTTQVERYKKGLYQASIHYLLPETSANKSVLNSKIKRVHRIINATLDIDRAKAGRLVMKGLTNGACLASGVGIFYNLSNKYYNNQLLFYSETNSQAEARRMEDAVIRLITAAKAVEPKRHLKQPLHPA